MLLATNQTDSKLINRLKKPRLRKLTGRVSTFKTGIIVWCKTVRISKNIAAAQTLLTSKPGSNQDKPSTARMLAIKYNTVRIIVAKAVGIFVGVVKYG